MDWSDGLNGQEGQVVDETGLLLDEGLAIADPGEQAVVAGLGIGTLANLFFGNKERIAGRLVGVLRAVGHEGGVALIDEGRDVDDEGGADVGVEAGLNYFEGAMGRTEGRWLIHIWGDGRLGES